MFEQAVALFFAQFPESAWTRAAIQFVSKSPVIGFDCPKTLPYIRWWVVEAGVHMNFYWHRLDAETKHRFNELKEQLPMWP